MKETIENLTRALLEKVKQEIEKEK